MRWKAIFTLPTGFLCSLCSTVKRYEGLYASLRYLCWKDIFPVKFNWNVGNRIRTFGVLQCSLSKANITTEGNYVIVPLHLYNTECQIARLDSSLHNLEQLPIPGLCTCKWLFRLALATNKVTARCPLRCSPLPIMLLNYITLESWICSIGMVCVCIYVCVSVCVRVLG